jgi:hypothetical protein
MTPTFVSTNTHPAVHRCLCDHGEVDVRTWRLCWLLDAGFEPELAESLAATPAVDLHAVLELVDRGCPPGLAARILSPLPPAGAS